MKAITILLIFLSMQSVFSQTETDEKQSAFSQFIYNDKVAVKLDYFGELVLHPGLEVGAVGAMGSYLSLAIFFNGSYLIPNFNILELNLSARMEKIKIPSLVIWGRHDGVNTMEMGYDAYNSIGGPGYANKELVILENSAHAAHVEEQELFLQAFRDFVYGL